MTTFAKSYILDDFAFADKKGVFVEYFRLNIPF